MRVYFTDMIVPDEFWQINSLCPHDWMFNITLISYFSSLSAPRIKLLVSALPALILLENNKTQEIVYGYAFKLVFKVAVSSFILI